MRPAGMKELISLLEVRGGKCKQDNGERTNRKLTEQPFYQRGRKGKMRSY